MNLALVSTHLAILVSLAGPKNMQKWKTNQKLMFLTFVELADCDCRNWRIGIFGTRDFSITHFAALLIILIIESYEGISIIATPRTYFSSLHRFHFQNTREAGNLQRRRKPTQTLFVNLRDLCLSMHQLFDRERVHATTLRLSCYF